MRILFVAFPHSVHTARWIEQFSDQGWQMHLFASYWARPHPLLRSVSVNPVLAALNWGTSDRKFTKHFFQKLTYWLNRILGAAGKAESVRRIRKRCLARTIERLKPDIIHSMEIQQGACLVLGARKYLKTRMPPWIVHNWGSDIFLFGRDPEHASRIREVLSCCQYYFAECERDTRLALEFGFQGKLLPVLPVAGGFETEAMRRFWQPGPVSARRTIVLKGYLSWAGRADVALRALTQIKERLGTYRLVVHSAHRELLPHIEAFRSNTGMEVEILPRTCHENILRLLGSARVAIGISISDAIPTSLLEAMVMGAFPVQTFTSCAHEWVQDGKTGILVPPDDETAVAEALNRALSDDALVDGAAVENYRVMEQRADISHVRAAAIEMYQGILKEIRPSAPVT